MLVDGATVMVSWMTAGRKTLKAEDDPLTKGNYPTYLRASGNFPRDQCLVRTGVQRAGVRRDDGLVLRRIHRCGGHRLNMNVSNHLLCF
jgi:hypothetical protein